jgi:hypothetical protein
MPGTAQAKSYLPVPFDTLRRSSDSVSQIGLVRPRQFADFFVIVITTKLVVMKQPATLNNRIFLR